MNAVATPQLADWRTLAGGATAHLVRGSWSLCGRAAGADAPLAIERGPVCQICASIGREFYTIGEMTGLGLTVRQLHHWCDRGWIRFSWTASGRRRFPELEYRVARRAVALIRAGYRTEAALARARTTVDEPSGVAVPEVP